MIDHDLRLRRWSRVEYERLVECGFFQPGDRIELIGGQLLVAEPQNSPHATAVGLAEDALREAFGRGWVVRVEAPIALDDESEPEPDVAVVPGTRRDYRQGHPQRPVLIVEVADTSLVADRTFKGSLYARAGVADYWIVNLVDHLVEIHRDPAPNARAAYGWAYRSVEHQGPGAVISPVALPDARVVVADILP
ncbi:MAG: Uma2 family endonuclease [Candidatus Rokuibacteriota bacterium]